MDPNSTSPTLKSPEREITTGKTARPEYESLLANYAQKTEPSPVDPKRSKKSKKSRKGTKDTLKPKADAKSPRKGARLSSESFRRSSRVGGYPRVSKQSNRKKESTQKSRNKEGAVLDAKDSSLTAQLAAKPSIILVTPNDDTHVIDLEELSDGRRSYSLNLYEVTGGDIKIQKYRALLRTALILAFGSFVVCMLGSGVLNLIFSDVAYPPISKMPKRQDQDALTYEKPPVYIRGPTTSFLTLAAVYAIVCSVFSIIGTIFINIFIACVSNHVRPSRFDSITSFTAKLSD